MSDDPLDDPADGAPDAASAGARAAPATGRPDSGPSLSAPDPARRTLFAVVAFCVLMNMLSRGYGETFAVFLLPLGDEFGWTRTVLTGAYVVYMLGYGLCAPAAGQVYARFGPRIAFSVGLACLGCGYLVAARAESPVLLYLGIGVLGALGAASIGIVATSTLVRGLVTHRLTTALGFAHAGLGTGVLVFAPTAQLLIDADGWRSAYTTLGVLPLLIAPLVALAPWHRFAPTNTPARTASSPPEEPVWTLRRAMRTTPFWGLLAVFYCTSGAFFMLAPQLVAYFVDEVGYSALEAASVIGASGMLSIAGMVSVAWMAERFGRIRVVTVSYIASAAGMLGFLALSVWPSPALLLAALALYGVTAGCRAPIIAELTSRLFTGRGYAAVLGGLNAGMGLGAGSGALVGAALLDATGRYEYLFFGAVVLLGIATSLFFLIGPLRQGQWLTTPAREI